MDALTGWLQPFLPSPSLVAWLAPLSALYAAGAAALAGYLRVRRGVAAPYTRKTFHFVIITMAAVLQIVLGLQAVVVFGAVVSLAVLYAVARGDGHPFYEAMARPTDAPHRSLFILVPLITTALGGVTVNLLFSPYAQVGYMVTGWGDAVGEPVGTRWGRHPYRVPSLAGVPARRSLEGSGAVFVASFLAALIVLLAEGVDGGRAAAAALACGVAAVLVEAVSSHGVDNFTVQVAAAGVAYWILA